MSKPQNIHELGRILGEAFRIYSYALKDGQNLAPWQPLMENKSVDVTIVFDPITPHVHAVSIAPPPPPVIEQAPVNIEAPPVDAAAVDDSASVPKRTRKKTE